MGVETIELDERVQIEKIKATSVPEKQFIWNKKLGGRMGVCKRKQVRKTKEKEVKAEEYSHEESDLQKRLAGLKNKDDKWKLPFQNDKDMGLTGEEAFPDPSSMCFSSTCAWLHFSTSSSLKTRIACNLVMTFESI